MSGGLGADTYLLSEAVAATDTIKIAAGESLVTGFDLASDFKLSVGSSATLAGVDRLDLPSTLIAANASNVNGVDYGNVGSHSIVKGLASFKAPDGTPLAVTSANLLDAAHYLQAAITGNNSVVFVAESNSYIFQDNGANDILVQLTGVSASGLSVDGLATGSAWLI